MMSKLSKRIVVDVTPEVHKALKLKAVREDKELAVVIRGLALAWLEGGIDFPEGRGHPEDQPRQLQSVKE